MVAKAVDTTNVQYQIYQTGSSLNCEVGDSGGNDQASASSQMSAGTWKHHAMRKNGTGAGALAVFTNGSSVATATSNRTIQNTANSLFIGQRSDNNAITAFDGRLAEVGIWDVALSDAEIAALATGVSPLLIRPANLKGYWPVYGSGSPEADLSGNGNNATITGTLNAADHSPTGRVVLTATGARYLVASTQTLERSAALDAGAAVTASGIIVHTFERSAALSATAAVTAAGRQVDQPQGVSLAFGQSVLEPYPTWTRIDA